MLLSRKRNLEQQMDPKALGEQHFVRKLIKDYAAKLMLVNRNVEDDGESLDELDLLEDEDPIDVDNLSE